MFRRPNFLRVVLTPSTSTIADKKEKRKYGSKTTFMPNFMKMGDQQFDMCKKSKAFAHDLNFNPSFTLTSYVYLFREILSSTIKY